MINVVVHLKNANIKAQNWQGKTPGKEILSVV
jgi:hypothetical protein